VLYYRHKLQKGLLSPESRPTGSKMDEMVSYLAILEDEYQELEASIIRNTKIAKVLKIITKLTGIPRDEELKFRERCHALLGIWTKILNDAADTS
jgi:hypothetical protein